MNLEKIFPKGLLRPELFLGVASLINASSIGVNLSEAGQASGSHYAGGRYGRGEVGEFVLIEGQQNLLLGRISEVYLREADRRSVTRNFVGNCDLCALGTIQLLGCVCMETLRVTAGVDSYPRLGDRIFAAPHTFIARLPQLMEREEHEHEHEHEPVVLKMGAADTMQENEVAIRPERLFGRHCAILGSTGGGKSWTTARIIEECLNHNAKMILLDATGEYRSCLDPKVIHCHLDQPLEEAKGSIACSLPPSSFQESDFIALFEPAGKVQAPKFREAIRSLRLAELREDLAEDGIIKKHDKIKTQITEAEQNPKISSQINDPHTNFNVFKLVDQIIQECVYPTPFKESTIDRWGSIDSNSYANCLSLLSRIESIIHSESFKCVFNNNVNDYLDKKIINFIKTPM